MIDAKVRQLLETPRNVRIALVGASTNPRKFGNIILKDLERKNFRVVPINPKESSIEGLPSVPSVDAVEGDLHIINFVVPPSVATRVVEGIVEHTGAVAWFQPGSFDAETLAAANARFDTVVAGPCIMVEAK